MKNLIILVLLLLPSYSLLSQNCATTAEKVGFRYYSIPDTCYTEIEHIEFIVSTPFNKNNPTILFLQGSGNIPLLFFDEKSGANFYIIPPFKIEAYKQKYNFVCISKPATPICKQWEGNPPLIDTTFPQYMNFMKMDFLDYYINQTNQVINYLQKSIVNKETPIYLIGNSQGGKVAVKYTALYPDKIKKLIMYSCSIWDRTHEGILSLRQDVDCGKMSADIAQEKINKIYEHYLHERKYHDYYTEKPNAETQYTLEEHYSTLTDYTYNFDIPINYLLRINIPILCVYGTRDLKARDNDLLPLIFARAYKDNLTMLPQLNCDHFFVQCTYNEKTRKTENKYIGDKVFGEIIKWISTQ